jgi:hypothetical protein
MNSSIGSHFLAVLPNTLQVYRAPLEVAAGRRRSYLIKVEPIIYNVISCRALI